MEEQPMKVTVIGAALIVAAVIAAILLLRYLDTRRDETNPPMA
jgi:hypothetical protein